MRCDPGERDGQQPAPQPDLIRQVITIGVDHDGGVDAVERSVAGQQLLAGVPLLRGCPEEDDCAVQPVPDPGERQESTHPGGGDDVVAAGMPDPREGVVLAEHGDRRPAPRPADLRTNCGGDAMGSQLGVNPVLNENVGDQPGAIVLLKRGLRTRMERVNNPLQVAVQGFDIPVDGGTKVLGRTIEG